MFLIKNELKDYYLYKIMLDWLGYYEQFGIQYKMNFISLTIDEESGQFHAEGNDICGNYRYEGIVQNTVFNAVKHYPTWDIYYSGDFNDDKQEISGFWRFNHGNSDGKFKIWRLKSVELAEYNKDSFDECSICIYQFMEGQKIKILNCGHFYHSLCLDQWISSHYNCPMCRALI